MIEDVSDRHNELAVIEQSIADIRDLFTQMAFLVGQQVSCKSKSHIQHSRTLYRVLQSLQDSRLGCLPLCVGQGRLRGASLLSPLVPLAQAGR